MQTRFSVVDSSVDVIQFADYMTKKYGRAEIWDGFVE
jgi:hypothetical protein